MTCPVILFEQLREEHIPEVTEIYNHYIVNSTVTFNTEPLTSDEMKCLVMNMNDRHPSFIISCDDMLAGYVLLAPFKTRQAYELSGEISIYLKPEFIGQGIGRQALQHIEGIAKEHGFHTLLAGICTENESSIKLFERNGYLQCAHFQEVGYKFNRFLGVAYFQKFN